VYLLDTNVISAMAPTKRDRPEALVAWLQEASDRLFLSVVTASEVMAGIHRADRLGDEAKAARLHRWWTAVEHLYGRRVLPVDLDVARAAGAMIDRSRAFASGYADIAIAATAQVHGLVVLTANGRHFEPLGVRWIDPLKAIPTR
jgi:predicted nucleic acid-binding protein